ncbi:hypothetical protein G9A89_012793 [Geosiphon pyriformis]|nr:hypothetical protein G9A89_012793 [Geosiphon pyriformis]
MSNIHDDKKKDLDIAKAVLVRINNISIETNMEVSKAKEYTIIVGNKWLKKAKVLLDYELCKLTIRCDEKFIVVKYCHWTTPLVLKQNQEEKQSDESDDNESDEEEDQEEPKETIELAYIIFIRNDKPLKNIKADKEGIMINNKLIYWPYYNILRRTFDRKPGKKAKYNYWWHGLCAKYWCNKPFLIPREELKEVQMFFESEPPEIQSLVIEQKELFPKKRKMNIENLLAKNSPVISKENNTPR